MIDITSISGAILLKRIPRVYIRKKLSLSHDMLTLATRKLLLMQYQNIQFLYYNEDIMKQTGRIECPKTLKISGI